MLGMQTMYKIYHNQETMYLPPVNGLRADLYWTFNIHQLTFLP